MYRPEVSYTIVNMYLDQLQEALRQAYKVNLYTRSSWPELDLQKIVAEPLYDALTPEAIKALPAALAEIAIGWTFHFLQENDALIAWATHAGFGPLRVVLHLHYENITRALSHPDALTPETEVIEERVIFTRTKTKAAQPARPRSSVIHEKAKFTPDSPRPEIPVTHVTNVTNVTNVSPPPRRPRARSRKTGKHSAKE